jgi:DNA polymerase-4
MLRVLYVDMNSFFASVEQQLRPELVGRPIAIVPMMVDTTSVIAASYPAKKFGVKTGTRVGDAKRMCPGLILVQSRHDEYIRFHHKVLAAIDTVIPVDRVCSIDEVSCKLLREQTLPENASAVARRVKGAIARDCGGQMTASIGVAPNRFLAKVAADMQKPDGLTIVQKHELPGRLFTLQLIDLPGIGAKMLERLRSAGIATVERLCALEERELGRAWGSVIGREWYYRLRGELLFEEPTIKRSIGHSHVLSPKRRGDDAARAVAVRLLTKLAQRTRSLGYIADRLTLGMAYFIPRGIQAPRAGQSPPRWHETARLESVNDTTSLLRALSVLWENRPKQPPGPILRLSVTLHDVTPVASATGSLFADRRDPSRLSRAMDSINRRYGVDCLYPASMQDARNAAPRRIAFGNIPDLDTPDLSE